MSLREKVTEAILKYSGIAPEKADEKRRFYYKCYEDNLYCPLGNAALKAYADGSGAETRPTEKKVRGKLVQSPAKMASVVSSSAMTFNILGNEPVTFQSDKLVPAGKYEVFYEKQMYTVKRGSNPANLDAFLRNEQGRTAVFCEMKFLEWLGAPGTLKDAYLDESYYFKPDNSSVKHPVDAYSVFNDVIAKLTARDVPDRKKPGHKLYQSVFAHYDAWQMLKHLLAIYNYTSFVTKDSVNSFGAIPSMAGEYDKIILLNVVNEFPAECIEELSARNKYTEILNKEQKEAELFVDTVNRSGISHLFENNCNARVEIKYVSAREFAEELEMTEDKRDYLRRYFT